MRARCRLGWVPLVLGTLLDAACGGEVCLERVATAWSVPAGDPEMQDNLAAVAVDRNGDVVVVGDRGSDGDGIAVAKHSAADGTVLWTRMLGGIPADRIAVDGDQILLVANRIGQSAFATRLGSDGAEIWRVLLASGDLDPQALAVAVDPAGDVFITGHYDTTSGNDGGIHVTKLAGDSGTPLWQRVFADVGTTFDVGVDAGGDLRILGYTTAAADFDGYSLSPADELYVVQLSGADGTAGWATRWAAGDTSLRGRPLLAVEPGGDAFVAGTFGPRDPDGSGSLVGGIALARLSAGGDVVWRHEVAGEISPTGVAVGTDGIVAVIGRYGGPADLDGDGDSCDRPRIPTECNGGGNVAPGPRVGAPSSSCTRSVGRAFLARFSAVDGSPTGDGALMFDSAVVDTTAGAVAASPAGFAVSFNGGGHPSVALVP